MIFSNDATSEKLADMSYLDGFAKRMFACKSSWPITNLNNGPPEGRMQKGGDGSWPANGTIRRREEFIKASESAPQAPMGKLEGRNYSQTIVAVRS